MNNNPMQLLMQLMRMGNNPNQIINSLFRQNPQAQSILNQVKQSGMSTKDFTIQYAQKNNIDLNQIIQALTNYGIKL